MWNRSWEFFPSDHLSWSIARSGTVINNNDPRTERYSHWLAVDFRPNSSSAYFFDSYRIILLVPSIQVFVRCNCTVWHYNKRQIQCLTITSPAYIAVYSLTTLLGVTAGNILSDTSIPTTQSDRSIGSSLLHSEDRYQEAAVNAAPFSIKGS